MVCYDIIFNQFLISINCTVLLMCTKKLAIVGPLILVAVPLELEVHYIVLEVRVEDTVMRHNNKIPNTLF